MVRTLVHASTTVILAILVIFVFGMVSYVGLPRESAPDIEIPFVIVSTPYIGVSPEDIEGLVTIPMERELASLTDVKKMESSSSEGVSIIAIEFEPEANIDESLQKVRDRVNRAKPNLPADAEEPSVAEVSFSDIPILLVTIAGGEDEEALKQLAEDLQDQITRITGVLDADVTGGREREVRVQVLPERLAHYGLSMNDVVTAIQGENVNIPGGNVTSGSASFLLRVPGEFTSTEQIEHVAIKRVGDAPVFVTDVARVVDGFEDRATYSRMQGRPSVTVSVKKRTGSNMLAVSDSVRALVAEQAKSWPAGVSYNVLGDQSEEVENMVQELQNNIITALILVVGVLLVFMGARNSLFVAVAIPLSMLMSFLVLDGLDYTLNMVVLFSLILALGMLVDNAIVVVENVYRHLEMGKSREDASVDGTNEVAVAVAASTATTVAAFFPMIFWTGIMGQFMGFLPKTVIIVLSASLGVAVFILPVLTSRLMADPKGTAVLDPETENQAIDPATLGPVMGRYYAVLQTAIRHRYISLGLGVATLVVSLGAYGVLNHGIEFFPATEPDRATVGVRLPEGADLEATDRVVRAMEAVLAATDNVDTFVSEVGVAGSGNALEGASNASNQARITVDFLPAADKAEPGETVRVESTSITMFKLRALAARIPGAEVSINQQEMGPPVGKPIEIQVSGSDFHEVGLVAKGLMREIEKIEGVTDLSSDYRVGRPELRLRVDRGAAKRVGVSTQAVGGAVRSAIAGTKASALRDGEDEYDIVVEVAPEYKSDIQRILQLRVPGREDTSPNTFPVPLSAVATYEIAGGSGTIKHLDQDLVVTIAGDVVNKDEEAMVRQEVTKFLSAWEAPPGISVGMGGAAEEQQAAMDFLVWAFGLAVALILMVLVAQFDSIALPAIIMFTVVLSLVGVLWGLILTGTPFGIIMTGIGVISLAGVVVNNAIVLLDYVEQVRKRGLSVNDALLLAGVTRFRPVMLTAVTTTLGLIPMAIGMSIDFTEMTVILGSSSAQFWGPMAIAVIFGLTFATVLTLVMVPTMYAILEDIRGLVGRLLGRQTAAVASLAVAGILTGSLLAPGTAHAVTLEQAYAAAEANNIDLALVREQTAQAKTLQWQALSAVFPRLSASMSYKINQSEQSFDAAGFAPDLGDFPQPPDFSFPGPFNPFGGLETYFDEVQAYFDGFDTGEGGDPIVIQPKQAWNGAFTVYQPLLSGNAFPAWRGAKAVYRAALQDESRAQQQIRAGVARSYYALASAREALKVQDTSVQLAMSQLVLATRQVDAGLADSLARMQAELGVSRAERDLLQARSQLAEAEETFARVTGLPGSVDVTLPPPIEVGMTLEQALDAAASHRPDVAAAQERANAARLERTGRDLEWLPSVDFSFTEIYNEVPGFVPENWQWQAAFNFNWTLWDGGLRIARSRELASRTRAAKLRITQLQQIAQEEVRISWSRLQRADRAYAAVQEEVALAEEMRRAAEARFEAGRVTWLDVEQARVGLQGSRLSLVMERMNRDMAAIELLVATGRFGRS